MSMFVAHPQSVSSYRPFTYRITNNLCHACLSAVPKPNFISYVLKMIVPLQMSNKPSLSVCMQCAKHIATENREGNEYVFVP